MENVLARPWHLHGFAVRGLYVSQEVSSSASPAAGRDRETVTVRQVDILNFTHTPSKGKHFRTPRLAAIPFPKTTRLDFFSFLSNSAIFPTPDFPTHRRSIHTNAGRTGVNSFDTCPIYLPPLESSDTVTPPRAITLILNFSSPTLVNTKSSFHHGTILPLPPSLFVFLSSTNTLCIYISIGFDIMASTVTSPPETDMSLNIYFSIYIFPFILPDLTADMLPFFRFSLPPKPSSDLWMSSARCS